MFARALLLETPTHLAQRLVCRGRVHFWTTGAQLAGSPRGGRIGSSKGEAGRNSGMPPAWPVPLLPRRCFPGSLSKKLLSSFHSLGSSDRPLQWGQRDSTAASDLSPEVAGIWSSLSALIVACSVLPCTHPLFQPDLVAHCPDYAGPTPAQSLPILHFPLPLLSIPSPSFTTLLTVCCLQEPSLITP